MISTRPEAELLIKRLPVTPSEGINAYEYTLRNNASLQKEFIISLEGPFELLSPERVWFDAEVQVKGRLVVRGDGKSRKVVFVFRSEGIEVRKEAGFF